MKHINQTLQNYPQLIESEQPTESINPHSDIAVLLWVRMSEIYGHLWISNYGDTPNKSWIDMLATLSIAQIKHGLELCKNKPDMPNLPAFKALCKAMPNSQRFKELSLFNATDADLDQFQKILIETKHSLPASPKSKSEISALLKSCVAYEGVIELREKAEKKRIQELRAEELRQKLTDPVYIAEQEAKKEFIRQLIIQKQTEQEGFLNQE